MPRPTKLTPKTREVILNALRAGMTRSAAAATAGVHRSQMTRWLARYAAFATEDEFFPCLRFDTPSSLT